MKIAWSFLLSATISAEAIAESLKLAASAWERAGSPVAV
jgi:hypothetical protein